MMAIMGRMPIDCHAPLIIIPLSPGFPDSLHTCDHRRRSWRSLAKSEDTLRDMACFTATLSLRPFTAENSRTTDPTPTRYPKQRA
ncbi:hypothetical protein Y032_0073g752 [Ancylostoma ceylanicum]|uniref:Uncharacterized protein n=1 Tax=Ancylostoma ceylanicum TaxID=53326 RepID=A0A016TWY3_9BILA|nr:hypothetical protein Y032_0073g752 [Ancylostoma ceylanicum]